jgi:hypothetical protein
MYDIVRLNQNQEKMTNERCAGSDAGKKGNLRTPYIASSVALKTELLAD